MHVEQLAYTHTHTHTHTLYVYVFVLCVCVYCVCVYVCTSDLDLVCGAKSLSNFPLSCWHTHFTTHMQLAYSLYYPHAAGILTLLPTCSWHTQFITHFTTHPQVAFMCLTTNVARTRAMSTVKVGRGRGVAAVKGRGRRRAAVLSDCVTGPFPLCRCLFYPTILRSEQI